MNDDPAAVDESAAEATNVDDSESDMSETAGSEMGADDSEADDAMNGQSVDSLIEQIAAHDEELAAAAHELGDRIDTLETEVDNKDAELNELSEKLRRSRADFQNYKKRTEKNKKEMKARATEDLVVRLADVRENLFERSNRMKMQIFGRVSNRLSKPSTTRSTPRTSQSLSQNPATTSTLNTTK